MKKGYIPTSQEVDRLYQRATSGDATALQELGDLNNKLAKRANERMRDIERQGLEGTAAYNRAKYYIQDQEFGGGEYFSQSRKLDPDDLLMNIDNVSEYLRAETSTSAGERRRRQNISDSLENKGFFDDVAPEDVNNTKKQLLDFFDTDAWEDIRKHNKGGTNEMVAEAVEAIENGALLGDLKRAFKDFQRGADTDYIDIWKNWTSANQYYKSGGWHELKRRR